MSQAYTDPANEAKHDMESGRVLDCDNEFCKRWAYVAAFAVFQTVILLILVLTIMTIRTPIFGVPSASLEDSSQFGTPQNPSFNLKMDAELAVKNANFGNYKFQNSSIFFFYGDARVGHAVVPKTKAGWRSTKKLHVVVDLSSNGLPSSISPRLRDELKLGVLTLNSRSKLDGKVERLFIFKKKKSIYMDCILAVGVAEKAVRQISCK